MEAAGKNSQLSRHCHLFILPHLRADVAQSVEQLIRNQ